MPRDRSPRRDAEPQRLFVAVPIPDPIAEVVEAATGPWRAVLPQARWVERSDWHVTLHFLGSTHPGLLPRVRERLAEVSAATLPFPTRVRNLGAFPSTRRARVLWAGLVDADRRFAALASAIQRSVAGELAPEGRAYTAHLTVARSDPPLTLPEGYAETSLESEGFTVGALVLMRSHVGRRSPRYEPLETYPLGSGVEWTTG